MPRRHRQSARRAARHPFDWYVEPVWAVEQFFDAVPLIGSVGDPACGIGTIPRVAAARGHLTIAADIVDRGYRHMDAVANFLEDASAFAGIDNIVTNPPYSYRPAIAEAFVRRAVGIARRTVAIVVPIRWLASEVRYNLFADLPPSDILVCSERPSMPPGDAITGLGDRAHRGGTIDYCWIVWTVGAATGTQVRSCDCPPGVRTHWIRPRPRGLR